MTDFDAIRDLMATAIPFSKHVGIELVEVGPRRGVAKLPDAPELLNHVGTQHAGALFTVAETASGMAMLSVFADHFASVTPVARRSSIEYLRLARGPITATGTLEADPDELLARLDADGKVEFPVGVSMTDEGGKEVATVEVTWHLKRNG